MATDYWLGLVRKRGWGFAERTGRQPLLALVFQFLSNESVGREAAGTRWNRLQVPATTSLDARQGWWPKFIQCWPIGLCLASGTVAEASQYVLPLLALV